MRLLSALALAATLALYRAANHEGPGDHPGDDAPTNGAT